MKITIIFILSIVTMLNGQDALFSQLTNNKNLLNPSLLSQQSAPINLNLNFREQGASVSSGLPLRTFQAVANFTHESLESDKIAYGLSVFGDRGGTGHIGTNMIHGHFSYLKKLTGRYSKIGEQYLSIGTSIGAGQRAVNWERFWFGNQFNREYYYIDKEVDSGEEDLLQNERGRTGWLTDINVGINWYAIPMEGLALQAGFSAFHLNRSNISLFAGGNERQRIRYNAHVNASKSIYDNVNIIPQLIYIHQGVSNQIIFGSEIEIDNLDVSEVIMRFGLLSRVVSNQNVMGFDALTLNLNTVYNKLSFGLAYDITISRLAKFNNSRGAWEMNLGYSFSQKSKTGYSRSARRFKF